MSCIQLPYGVVEDKKTKIKLDIPRNSRTREYFKKLPHLRDVSNSVVDFVNNRDGLHKFLLAMSNIGRNIQEILNGVVTEEDLTTP